MYFIIFSVLDFREYYYYARIVGTCRGTHSTATVFKTLFWFIPTAGCVQVFSDIGEKLYAYKHSWFSYYQYFLVYVKKKIITLTTIRK